jgi:hypothetical protein
MSEAKHQRQARWRERNPMKVWAQAALRSAVTRGLVEPRPCEVCGDPNSEAHHPDYSRPAAVRWLCRKHHKAEHRNGGAR